MGVSKYIEEISSKIEQRIQKNLESIAAAPYPLEDLEKVKAASPESALAKSFGQNGELPGADALRSDAIQQDPSLYKRLFSGAKSLKKAEQNEKLSEVDPSSLLSSRYSEFVSGLAKSSSLGSDLSIDAVLSSSPDEFEEVYAEVMPSDGLLDTSSEIIIAAFAELRAKGGPQGRTGPQINEGTGIKATETTSVVNLPKEEGPLEEGVEKVSSAVVGTKVEVPKEEPEVEKPISINIENTVPTAEIVTSEQKEAPTETRVETPTVTINDNRETSITDSSQSNSSTINETPTQTSQPRSGSTQPAQAQPSVSTTSSIYSLANQFLSNNFSTNASGSDEFVSTSESKTINSKEEASSQKESAKETTQEAGINSSRERFESFFEDTSSSKDASSYLSAVLGSNFASSIFSEKSKDSKETSSTETETVRADSRPPAASDLTESPLKGSFTSSSDEKMGVTRDSPKFSERIQPAPKQAPPAIQQVAAVPAAQPVSATQVSAPEQVSTVMTQSLPESQAASSSQAQAGMTELAQRMARIEYLLSNTLDVKLVD